MSLILVESCIRQAPVKKPIEKCSRCSDPIERGAFDYVPKPVNLAHLQSVIAAAAAAAPPA